MSRKKPQPVTTLLGPDGKPLDRAKYAPKPEPTATVMGVDVSADVKDYTFSVSTALSPSLPPSYHDSIMTMYFGPSSDGPSRRALKPKPRSLAARVEADVTALTADFEGESRPELPVPPPDLTAYADAYTHAVKTCPHTNIEDTIHSRGEYQCVDCGRYLSADDMRKRRDSSSFFGRYFS